MNRLAIAIITSMLATGIGVARATTCDTPPNPRQPMFEAGIDLSSGLLRALPIARLGPLEIVYNECATANSGVTFGIAGVYTNADAYVSMYPDGSVAVVSNAGLVTYQGPSLRRIPDDGSFIEVAADHYVLHSPIAGEDRTFRRFGRWFLLSQIDRATGDASVPFEYSYFYDRDSLGALTGIRQSNSGDRLAIEHGAGFVRATLTIANRGGPADWFVIHHSDGRLSSVEIPAPEGTASIAYALTDAARISEVVHPSGATTRYVHDGAGRITENTVYDTATPTTVFDRTTYGYQRSANGLVTSIRRDGEGASEAAQLWFGDEGMLHRVQRGGVTLAELSYDAFFRIQRASYPEDGQAMFYFHRGISDFLATVVRQDGSLVYTANTDGTGLLPASQIAFGEPTMFEHDALHRITRVVARDGSARSATATAVDRPSLVDHCVIDESSGHRDCTRVDYLRGGAVVERRSGTVGLEMSDHVTRYDLDPSNFVIRSTDSIGLLATDQRIYAGNDDRGLPATVFHTDFIMGGPIHSETYARLADGRVAALTTEDDLTTRLTYDPIGQIRKATLERGRAEPVATVEVGPRPDCVRDPNFKINGAAVSELVIGDPATLPSPALHDGPPTLGFGGGAPTEPEQVPPGSYPPENPPPDGLPAPGNGNNGYGFRPPNGLYYGPGGPRIFWPIELTSDGLPEPNVCRKTHYICRTPPRAYSIETGPGPLDRIHMLCHESPIFLFPHGMPGINENWNKTPALEVPGYCGDGRKACIALAPGTASTTTMGRCLGTVPPPRPPVEVDPPARRGNPDDIGAPDIDDTIDEIRVEPPPDPDPCTDVLDAADNPACCTPSGTPNAVGLPVCEEQK